MISQEINILNRYGIHARPSSMIADLAENFQSTIIFEKDGKKADARNIMNLILLSIGPNSKITVHINGPDETSALKALIDLIEVRCFDE